MPDMWLEVNTGDWPHSGDDGLSLKEIYSVLDKVDEFYEEAVTGLARGFTNEHTEDDGQTREAILLVLPKAVVPIELLQHVLQQNGKKVSMIALESALTDMAAANLVEIEVTRLFGTERKFVRAKHNEE